MRVSVETCEIPLRWPLITARGNVGCRTVVRLVVRTSDGLFAQGEAAPLAGHSRDEVRDCALALSAAATAIGCAVGGSDGVVPEGVAANFDDLPAARFAVESVLLSLAAQRSGRRPAEVLSRDARSSVAVNALVSAADDGEILASTAQACRDGFRTVKIKLTGKRLRDLERIERLEATPWPQLAFRFDCNGAYRDPHVAAELLTRLARSPLAVEYVEQPLPPGESEATAALRRASDVAIALDEDAADESRLAAALEARAADVYVLRPTLLGGARAVLNWAAKIRGQGGDVVVASLLETSVGLPAVFDTACAVECERACGLATGIWLDDPPDAALAIDDGVMYRCAARSPNAPAWP